MAAPDVDELPVALLAQSIELVAIESIEPHPDNPNEGDVGAISESVDELGAFYQVVFVQRSTDRILAGEHRWRTLRELGSPVAPVVWLDVDDDQALQILIGDNEIPRQRSHPNERKLAALLTDMQQQRRGRLRGTGHDGDTLDLLLNVIARRQNVAPPPSHEPPPREIATGVMFRFGDYGGWVNDSVYATFRTAYEAKREETGEVTLDDVLALWLGL